MNAYITTTEAARIAGVGVTSIKRWADDALVRSVRTPGGHRRIDRDDLMRLVLGSNGPTGDGAASSSGRRGKPIVADDATRWADLLLNSNVFAVQSALLEARGRLGAWSAACDEAARGMSDIGRRWACGEITALEEHLASDTVQRALAGLCATTPDPPANRSCLLVCPPGEDHTLGLAFVQLCLKEAGWRPVWIGTSVPCEELGRYAERNEIGMVAMSASEAGHDAEALDAVVRDLLPTLRRTGAQLVLGGGGPWPDFRDVPIFRALVPFSRFLARLQAGSV